MIRSIFIVLNIRMSRKINGFLYFLKNIPLIKRMFKNTNYSPLKIKKFLSILSILYNAVAGPIKFALLFFLAVYLPAAGFSKSDLLNSILFILFVFYFLAKLLGSDIMSPNEEKFVIIKQMKMNPKAYGLGQMISSKLIDLFSKSLVLSLVFKYILEKNGIIGVQIAITIVMFSIITEAIHLYLYKNTGFIINKLKITVIILTFLGIAGNYAVIAFTNIPDILNLAGILMNPITTIIITAFGVLSFIYLLNYDRYWDVMNEDNNLDTFKEMNESLKDIHFQEVKLRDKDFTEESLRENDSIEKEGYDYLNYIFFKRHKRLVHKPMIIKALIIFGFFLVLSIVNMFFIETAGKAFADMIIDNYTLLIFFIYIICNSTSIIKAFFYSCDRSLLRYGFYKKGDALLNMFFVRFKRILFINMIPISILSIGLWQLVYFNAPDRINEVIPALIVTVLLGILFSVHYIFMYYILQPFTTGLEMKSPLYGIINYLVYFVSYILLNSNLSASTIFPYVAAFSAFYIVFASVLVYTKAPKTFRVK